MIIQSNSSAQIATPPSIIRTGVSNLPIEDLQIRSHNQPISSGLKDSSQWLAFKVQPSKTGNIIRHYRGKSPSLRRLAATQICGKNCAAPVQRKREHSTLNAVERNEARFSRATVNAKSPATGQAKRLVFLVARGRIELPTRGFSVATAHLIRPQPYATNNKINTLAALER